MFRNKINFTIISVLLFLIITIVSVYGQQDAPGIRKLMVFFSPTCHRCIEVKKELIPVIEKIFKDKIIIEYRDISDIENYKLLLSLKEKYSAKDLKITVPVFFFDGHFLSAEEVTKDNLTAYRRCVK